jgi:hypothetical protein
MRPAACCAGATAPEVIDHLSVNPSPTFSHKVA